jgi:hypothetical protein
MKTAETPIDQATVPRLKMRQVFVRAFQFSRRNIVTLSALSLLLPIPFAVDRFAAGPTENWYASGMTISAFLVANLAVYFQCSAITWASVLDLLGRPTSPSSCIAEVVRDFLPLLVIALTGLLTTALGYMLFILPGLIINMLLSVIMPVRIIERTNIIQTFVRSIDLTVRQRWPVAGLFILFLCIVIALQMAADALTGNSIFDFVLRSRVNTGWTWIVGSTIASSLGGTISSLLVSSLYCELRIVNGGIGPEAQAAIFD